MIYGIGVDTASIDRIKKSIERESFVKKVYGAKEIAFLGSLKNSAASFAANFAAKEAFSKALGTGILTGHFNLCDVQVLRKKTGKPYIELSGTASELATQKGLTAHVSLTHEANTATAFVVLEITAPKNEVEK